MQNKYITILLSSNNEAKISSTRNVFSVLYPDFKLHYHSISSGVNETPDTDEEAVKGCHTRIEQLENSVNYQADYVIALEGLTETNSFGSFVYGWAVIKDTATGKYYYGCSGKVMLPEEVSSRLSKDTKLSELVLSLYPQFSKTDMDKLGTNGVLTNGLYSRIHEFETALKCAFGSLAIGRGVKSD
ncbi:inosine/xanthosine triphosphatase [Xenorhabdus nematophila]|uniref:inosine/xanthosine triphosphatase n=1 Tax=Xenorhabdus nematophila TaxID=628 RepID=UPI0032B794DB